jgi:hypothetical protein
MFDCPKYVELILEINNYCYLLHLVGFAVLLCLERQCVCCEVCTEVEERTELRASNTFDYECVPETGKWNVKRSCPAQAYLKSHHRTT